MRREFRSGPDERERIRRTLVTVLESEPDLEFAWLHGSFLTTGGFRDIDIGVHLSATADARLQRGLELAGRLDQEIGFPIDVRVLNDAPVTFLFHVFREGRLLLSRNDKCLADLMERTVREYLDAAPLLRQATIEAYGRDSQPGRGPHSERGNRGIRGAARVARRTPARRIPG